MPWWKVGETMEGVWFLNKIVEVSAFLVDSFLPINHHIKIRKGYEFNYNDASSAKDKWKWITADYYETTYL